MNRNLKGTRPAQISSKIHGAAGALLCGALALGCSAEEPAPEEEETGSGGLPGDMTGVGGDATGGAPAVGGGTGDGGASAAGGAGSGGVIEVPDEVPSAGCELGTTLTEGAHTFELEGKERTFLVRLPETYDASVPWPLVLALHPNGSGSGYWDSDAAPRNAREVLKDKAVLIIADAIGGNWRDYGAEESTWDARLEEELLYFEQVIGEAKQGLCLDEGSLFSMGFSGGGSFSGVLGCRRTDIRAFAAGGSVIYFDPAECVGTPAALIALSEGDATEDRLAYVDYFRTRAGCAETSSTVEPAACIAYEDCAPEAPIHYCAHPGGHELPEYFMTAAWDFFSSVR
jgi:hypothetical protein